MSADMGRRAAVRAELVAVDEYTAGPQQCGELLAGSSQHVRREAAQCCRRDGGVQRTVEFQGPTAFSRPSSSFTSEPVHAAKARGVLGVCSGSTTLSGEPSAPTSVWRNSAARSNDASRAPTSAPDIRSRPYHVPPRAWAEPAVTQRLFGLPISAREALCAPFARRPCCRRWPKSHVDMEVIFI
jgi:hypothetical protein